MTLPARAGEATREPRVSDPTVNRSRRPVDTLQLLAEAASHPDVTDKAYRLYVLCVARFGDLEFTVEQASIEAGLDHAAASALLGALVTAELLERRLATVGYKDDGSTRIRRMKYRATDGGL